MDVWNTSFLVGWLFFKGYVSFREGTYYMSVCCMVVSWFSSSKVQSVDAVSSGTLFGKMPKKSTCILNICGNARMCQNLSLSIYIYMYKNEMQIHTVVCIYVYYYIHRNYAACLCPACATWFHPIIQSLLQWTLDTVTQERYPTRRPNSDRSTITDDSMRGNAALATCNKIGKPCVPWHFHMHHAYHIIIFYVQGYLKKGFKRGRIKIGWISQKWITNAAYEHVQDALQIQGCSDLSWSQFITPMSQLIS